MLSVESFAIVTGQGFDSLFILNQSLRSRCTLVAQPGTYYAIAERCRLCFSKIFTFPITCYYNWHVVKPPGKWLLVRQSWELCFQSLFGHSLFNMSLTFQICKERELVMCGRQLSDRYLFLRSMSWPCVSFGLQCHDITFVFRLLSSPLSFWEQKTRI